MENTNSNPSYSGQGKDTGFKSQIVIIFHYLQEFTATASMASAATGVPQKSITRYKRHLEKAGRLWEVEKKHCELTGYRAWYLTTNFNSKPVSSQLELF